MTIPGGFVAGDILGAADMNLLPAGVIGYATTTTAQTSIGTVTDLTSLTVTFTAVSSRLYRTTLHITASATNASDEIRAYITDGSNTAVQTSITPVEETGLLYGATLISLETGLSGSTTRKGRLGLGESGTLSTGSSATAPGIIIVEDLGPA